MGWAAVVAFLVGYYATIVGSNVGLALALHGWMNLLSERIYRGILLTASALLAVYGSSSSPAETLIVHRRGSWPDRSSLAGGFPRKMSAPRHGRCKNHKLL
jgi:hypothetical protein